MSPGARTVKVTERQRLDVREQVAANIGHHALGRAHHNLRVTQGREHARGVDDGRKENLLGKQLLPTRGQAVDDGAHHIGAGKTRDGGDRGEHAHREQRELGMPHVGEQAAHSALEVGRAWLGLRS